MEIINQLVALRQNSKNQKATKLQEDLLIKEMPYVYGLIAVACSSGLSPETSIRSVSKYMPTSVSGAFRLSISQIDSGKTFKDALSLWNENQNLRPLSHVLIESMESGVSAIPALDSLGRDSINKIRRKSDAALKKLPVTMLFPLVTCILPAFILLSIVPTLISGFMSVDW